MIVDETLDDMLEQLQSPRFTFYYYRQSCPVGEALTHPCSDYGFWINRQAEDIIQIEDFVAANNLLPLWEPIAELLGNAGMHGNKDSICDAPNGDPLKSLSIKVFMGDNGILVRIRNEGTGFDHKEVLSKAILGSEYSTHNLGGAGTRCAMHPALQVSYEDMGRTTNLMYLEDRK
jgi:hypothetical protein